MERRSCSPPTPKRQGLVVSVAGADWLPAESTAITSNVWSVADPGFDESVVPREAPSSVGDDAPVR